MYATQPLISGPLSEFEEYNLAFMLDPNRWPMLHLPMKRYQPSSFPEAGYMFYLDDEYAIFVQANMYDDRETLRSAPKQRFKKSELSQLVLQGWRVD